MKKGFDLMTINEALIEGVKTTVVGLSIVFSVLLILMIVLKIMEKIFYKAPKKDDIQEVQKPKIEEEPKVIKTTVKECQDENDDELIAVLTAAIAASLNTSTYNLKIKSYRRIQNNAPAWNRAGIREIIDSRF